MLNKNSWKSLLVAVMLLVIFPSTTFAQENTPEETYHRGQVIKISEEGERDIEGVKALYQLVRVKITEGAEKNKEVFINHGEQISITEDQKVKVGQDIVIAKITNPEGDIYQIADFYRLDKVMFIVLAFFLCILVINGWKGLGSLAGLIISLGVIVFFIVPQILQGRDPLFISVLGSVIIMGITLYLAHGFNTRTTLALVATFISLVITAVLAILSVQMTLLNGLGNEEASSLRFGPTANINFQGFLLGGIIIGVLGVLDDITAAQTAVVHELHQANKKFRMWDLTKRSFNVGREHISSLVNTLVLAYAGVSLPLFIFLVLNPTNRPLWFTLNSDFMAEEIIRTLAGSIGLVLAVPITTLLASWYYSRKAES